MNQRVQIIAEAGVNHNGDFSLAKQLIEAAANAGADFVKFQTFKAKKLASKRVAKAEYQKKNTGDESASQFEMLKKLEIPESWYPELIELANTLGIGFVSTGFDEESVDFLLNFNPPFIKIPSGEITNKPLIQHIASKKFPVILSTGMANLIDIENALTVLEEGGCPKEQVTVLHCTTQYPTPYEDVNLFAMQTIEKKFGVNVGYSDHTLGIEVPIAAVALGASVIEKHFTLNRELPGPDHKASLEPEELLAMVQGIRNVEKAISGSGEKVPTPSEQPNISIARRSIHTAVPISSGTVVEQHHLMMLRPGDGISPMEIDTVIGKTVTSDLEAFHQLKEGDLR